MMLLLSGFSIFKIWQLNGSVWHVLFSFPIWFLLCLTYLNCVRVFLLFFDNTNIITLRKGCFTKSTSWLVLAWKRNLDITLLVFSRFDCFQRFLVRDNRFQLLNTHGISLLIWHLYIPTALIRNILDLFSDSAWASSFVKAFELWFHRLNVSVLRIDRDSVVYHVLAIRTIHLKLFNLSEHLL